MVTNFLLLNSVVSCVRPPPPGGLANLSFSSPSYCWAQPICCSFWSDPPRFSYCVLFMSSILLFSTRRWHFSPVTDVNECLSAHACQLNQRCVNTVGSYVCQRLISCPPGYQINNDICEGTARFIGIKVAPAHSKCAACTSVVNMHVHNGRKAHCLVTQSILPPQRTGIAWLCS